LLFPYISFVGYTITHNSPLNSTSSRLNFRAINSANLEERFD
jgi:hypothetical protein